MASYTEINREVMNRRAISGWRWALPLTHEEFLEIISGEKGIYLTPRRAVPKEWFPALPGLAVLGLASGGGQQMPVLAKLGAKVVSVDISDEMLMRDKLVADREGVSLETIRHDITKPLPLDDEYFDLVFMPVCLCYMRKIEPVFSEIFRVLKPGGILLTGQDNGMNYLMDSDDEPTGCLPYDPIADERQMRECLNDGSGVQFSHTSAEIMKAVLDSGLTIDDVYEDTNGAGYLHDHGISSFVAIRAHKV